MRGRPDPPSEVARHRANVGAASAHDQQANVRRTPEGHLESVDLHLAGRKLDRFPTSRARIRGATAYFHGRPGSGVPEFDTAFDRIPGISRYRA